MDKVYLYGTCLVDTLYPNVGTATVALLEKAGIKSIFPQAQSCCGQPAWNSGFKDEALAVAASQLSAFCEDYPIIVPSASCAGTIKHQWPKLFTGHKDETLALEIAARTYELSEFLDAHLQIPIEDKGEKTKVAVHSSCSAWREMQVAEHIYNLLAKCTNVEIVQHERSKECCGFGGTFAIKQADISGTMAKDKAATLLASGAEVVVSQDSSCLMNFGGIFDKQGAKIKPIHIAEFLLSRLI